MSESTVSELTVSEPTKKYNKNQLPVLKIVVFLFDQSKARIKRGWLEPPGTTSSLIPEFSEFAH